MVAQMSLQPLWAQQLTHSDAVRRALISGREIILTYDVRGMLKSQIISQACKALRPNYLIDLCILVTCWHMRISHKLLTRPAYANPRRYAVHDSPQMSTTFPMLIRQFSIQFYRYANPRHDD